MALLQTPAPRPAETAQRRVLLAAALFLLIGCALQWWRMQSLTASMDQGILMQVLWNGLRGHPFESTLSSQLSTNVIHSGELPALGTTVSGSTSPCPGVMDSPGRVAGEMGFAHAAGDADHRCGTGAAQAGAMATQADLAAMVTIAFYGANAVIAPKASNPDPSFRCACFCCCWG